MRDAHVGAALGHQRAQGLQVRGAALHVDVGAAEVLVDDGDLGTKATQRLGAGHARRAVPHVERHLQALKVDALLGHGVNGVLDVQLARVVHGHGHAHLVAVRQLVSRRAAAGHERLDLVLHGVGQLEALAVEDLDAVVLRRVVRRGDDDAAVAVQLARQKRDGRRRDDARQKRRATHGHDAGGNGRLQHVAGQARVLADEDGAALEGHRGLAELEGHLAGQFLVRDAANPVSAEKTCHIFPLFDSC